MDSSSALQFGSSSCSLDHAAPRRVRFSVVEEFEYDQPNFSPEEIAALWYTMEEMVGLVKYELKLCEGAIDSSGVEKTWRGLEHMQGGEDTRAERVIGVLDRILDAFDELSYNGEAFETEDDKAEALRTECRALTREDRKRALKFGMRDATVAESMKREAAMAAMTVNISRAHSSNSLLTVKRASRRMKRTRSNKSSRSRSQSTERNNSPPALRTNNNHPILCA